VLSAKIRTKLNQNVLVNSYCTQSVIGLGTKLEYL